jgi:hypothetical protein
MDVELRHRHSERAKRGAEGARSRGRWRTAAGADTVRGLDLAGLACPAPAIMVPAAFPPHRARPTAWRCTPRATDRSRPRCTDWCSSMRPASSRTPRPAPERGCRGSSSTSSTRSRSTASWRTASCACDAASAATTRCWRSVASGAGSVRRAARGACRRRRRIGWITSSRRCRCASGCCRCRSRCGCCWPRSPS